MDKKSRLGISFMLYDDDCVKALDFKVKCRIAWRKLLLWAMDNYKEAKND